MEDRLSFCSLQVESWLAIAVSARIINNDIKIRITAQTIPQMHFYEDLISASQSRQPGLASAEPRRTGPKPSTATIEIHYL